MKYLLFVLLFLVVGKFSRAGDTLTVDGKKYVNVDSTKFNWNTLYGDTKEALKSIGSALKVGSEHVYEVLVKQQIVGAVTWLITFIVLLLGVILDVKLVKWLSDPKKDADSYTGQIVIAIVVSAGLVVGLLGFFCHISEIVTGFVNPEYGALKDIMEMVHPAK